MFYLFLPIFSTLILLSNVQAQIVEGGANSTSTAGSGRAALHPGDSHYWNPASTVHLAGRYLVGSFGAGSAGGAGGAGSSTSSADNRFFSFSDNVKDSFIPGAISYSQVTYENSLVPRQKEVFTISLAEFIINQVSFGISAHQIHYKENNFPYQEINADFGLMYTPRSNLGFGLVCYQIFGKKDLIPSFFAQNSYCGVALNYLFNPQIRYRLDLVSQRVQGGIESYWNEWLPVRIGYESDYADKISRASFGFGFEGPRFGINYGYISNLQTSSDYRHRVDLILPF